MINHLCRFYSGAPKLRKRTFLTELGDGTSIVELTRGLVATFDTTDSSIIAQYSWFASNSKQSRTFYARGRSNGSGRSAIHMHRLILGFPSLTIDHINGNGLDNRKSNLRLCTHQQNCCNVSKRCSSKTSAYRGVYRSGNKWVASIRVHRKIIALGRFDSELIAAAAYDQASREFHGEFGVRNNIEILT